MARGTVRCDAFASQCAVMHLHITRESLSFWWKAADGRLPSGAPPVVPCQEVKKKKKKKKKKKSAFSFFSGENRSTSTRVRTDSLAS